MIANIIILALVLGYCAYIIRVEVRNIKEGKCTGCTGSGCGGGCTGNCHTCGGCGTAKARRK